MKKGRKEGKKRLKNSPKKSLKVKKNLKTWRVVKEEQVLWLLLVPKLCAGRCTSPLLLLCYCCYEFKTCTTGSTRANSRKLHSEEFENWVTFEHSISRGSSRILVLFNDRQTHHRHYKMASLSARQLPSTVYDKRGANF